MDTDGLTLIALIIIFTIIFTAIIAPLFAMVTTSNKRKVALKNLVEFQRNTKKTIDKTTTMLEQWRVSDDPTVAEFTPIVEHTEQLLQEFLENLKKCYSSVEQEINFRTNKQFKEADEIVNQRGDIDDLWVSVRAYCVEGHILVREPNSINTFYVKNGVSDVYDWCVKAKEIMESCKQKVATYKTQQQACGNEWGVYVCTWVEENVFTRFDERLKTGVPDNGMCDASVSQKYVAAIENYIAIRDAILDETKENTLIHDEDFTFFSADRFAKKQIHHEFKLMHHKVQKEITSEIVETT